MPNLLLRKVSFNTLNKLNYERLKNNIFPLESGIIAELEGMNLSLVDFLRLCIAENDFTLTPFDGFNYINNPSNIYRTFETKDKKEYKNYCGPEMVLNQWFNLCVIGVFNSYCDYMYNRVRAEIGVITKNFDGFNVKIVRSSVEHNIPMHTIHREQTSEWFEKTIAKECDLRGNSNNSKLYMKLMRECIGVLIDILSADLFETSDV